MDKPKKKLILATERNTKKYYNVYSYKVRIQKLKMGSTWEREGQRLLSVVFFARLKHLAKGGFQSQFADDKP